MLVCPRDGKNRQKVEEIEIGVAVLEYHDRVTREHSDDEILAPPRGATREKSVRDHPSNSAGIVS